MIKTTESLEKLASLSNQRQRCHHTFEPVAVGVVLGALVHRFFVDNQAYMVVSTPDGGKAGRVSHLAPLHPAGHTQMHPQLPGPENNNSMINGGSQVPACTAKSRTGGGGK